MPYTDHFIYAPDIHMKYTLQEFTKPKLMIGYMTYNNLWYIQELHFIPYKSFLQGKKDS